MEDFNRSRLVVVQIPEEIFNEMVTEILAAKEEIKELKERVAAIEKFKSSPYFTIVEAMAYVRLKSRTTFLQRIDDGQINIAGYSSPGRPVFIKENLDAYLLGKHTKSIGLGQRFLLAS
jgi:hypothetical protein